MKLFLLWFSLSTGLLFAVADYNSLSVYGGLTYNVLVEFENSHAGCSSDSVREYVRSNALIHIKSDSFNMGYAWHSVLLSTYHIAMNQNVVYTSILEALNKELRYQLMWKDVFYYSSLGCSYFSTLSSLISIAFMLQYMKYDRRVINHYRAQSLGGFFPADDSD